MGVWCARVCEWVHLCGCVRVAGEAAQTWTTSARLVGSAAIGSSTEDCTLWRTVPKVWEYCLHMLDVHGTSRLFCIYMLKCSSTRLYMLDSSM